MLGLLFLLGFSCQKREVLEDGDGNRYKIVQFGSQQWMVENFKSTKTADGIETRYYFPNNDSVNKDDYGLLYDWETAVQLAPKGWHLPSDEEWQTLQTYLETHTEVDLKDLPVWNPKNITKNVGSNFLAKPAGYWGDNEFDKLFGTRAIFWSASYADSNFAWARSVNASDRLLHRAEQHRHYGFSVRFVKDN